MGETRRRLRILLAAPHSTGGIGRHVQMLAEGLAARGHEVAVAAPAPTLRHLDVAAAGATAHPVALGSARDLAATTRRLRVLASDHDVLHAHGVRVGAQAGVAGARVLVSTWHNAPLGGLARRATHRALEAVCARTSDAVLAASPDLVVRAERAGARHAVLCRVAAPRLAPPATPRLVSHGGRPTVLAIARLHPQKRLDLLIEAAAGWQDEPGAPRVLIAGDGPSGEALRAQAHRCGAPIEFLGPTDDVASLLAAADVLALPSDWEARPLVVQEALAAGVPVVATAVGGVPDLVGDAALLVAPDDPVALRVAIERILGDAELADRLRAAGPRQASTWPTASAMVEQVEATYLDLMSRSMRNQADP